jgi:hypothetical protein
MIGPHLLPLPWLALLDHIFYKLSTLAPYMADILSLHVLYQFVLRCFSLFTDGIYLVRNMPSLLLHHVRDAEYE